MQALVSGLVASYGYVVLFFLVGLESLGIPLPGETALVTAASLRSRRSARTAGRATIEYRPLWRHLSNVNRQRGATLTAG